MKLEELLQAIIDKKYPKDFLLNRGICASVESLLGVSELNRFDKAIAALYLEREYPVAGRKEYLGTIGTNMYASGLRADVCTRVLESLKANMFKKFYIRVFKRKRYTEAYPATPDPANHTNHNNPANSANPYPANPYLANPYLANPYSANQGVET